ncbi:type II toxin-antitoxin system RelE/ParE family toxin [bacterium]|nr:type II toxin-antitoxin system RelE/ParE family toxin [bacterium]
MRIEFHPDASRELEAACAWHDEHNPGAASNFIASIDEVVDLIAHDPGRFTALDDRHRSCSLACFPFQIVYQHYDQSLFILAVAHAKRPPGYWKQRSGGEWQAAGQRPSGEEASSQPQTSGTPNLFPRYCGSISLAAACLAFAVWPLLVVIGFGVTYLAVLLICIAIVSGLAGIASGLYLKEPAAAVLGAAGLGIAVTGMLLAISAMTQF